MTWTIGRTKRERGLWGRRRPPFSSGAEQSAALEARGAVFERGAAALVSPKSPRNPLPQTNHPSGVAPPPSRSAMSDLNPRACRALRRGGECVLALFLLTVPQHARRQGGVDDYWPIDTVSIGRCLILCDPQIDAERRFCSSDKHLILRRFQKVIHDKPLLMVKSRKQPYNKVRPYRLMIRMSAGF